MSASSLLLVWLACICTSLAGAYVVSGTSFPAAEAAEANVSMMSMLFKRARYLLVLDSLTPVCSDSCRWAKDAVCQDGGLGTNFSSGPGCDFGTDCTDCGSRRMGDDPTAGMIDYDIALLRHFYGSNYSGISSAIVARMNRVANDTLDTARPKWEDAEFS